MVVEDNDDVRDLVVATIKDLGYRIVVAADGRSALQQLRGDRLDRSGIHRRRHARRNERLELLIREAVPCGTARRFLVTSGYAGVQCDEIKSGKLPLLLKPYHRAELAKKIRSALSGA